ncbi:MAG: M13 family metallopeptidase [Muribaculaceae bacterium]
MNAGDNVKGGVNRANLDVAVAPGEDFYQYATGGWQKNHPLDPQYARFGTFDALAENNREQIKDLILNLDKTQHERGSVAQKVNDLYKLGMDSVRLNNEGASPLSDDLARIASMKRADLMNTLVWMHKGVSSAFFGVFVMADLQNSDVNIVYAAQAGLGMGDRDYYLENDENSTRIRNAYIDYIKTIMTLAGYKPAAAKKAAKTVLKIETEIAKVTMTREESRDISRMYNIYNVEKAIADFPHINWNQYLTALGLNGVDKLCITEPKALAKVDELMNTLTDQEVKDYLAYNVISSASPYLSDKFVDANFEMFSHVMSGKTQQQPRWKRALSVPNGVLGEAVGELYVNKYFPASSKEKMLKLVNNLKVSLAEHIANLDWMSDKTKVNALVKLNSFSVKIGYPDKWRDYSGIDIDPTLTYWENIKRARAFETAHSLSKYGKPVDREEWGMTPQTVNAYYNPTTNEICFPAGILQAPYFDPEADDASNYGAIGVVIGHEMTHGFDDQGRNFDQNGNMTDWWTQEDADKFKAKTQVLIEQFNNIIVLGDTHANGAYTLGENIADQGGLRVSYTAFKKTDQGKSSEKTDGFTPDQRFYLSYANVWAANITNEEILRRTKVDVHSLGKWRVNGSLRNINTFFDAFGIKSGDSMYLEPDQRVIIW